MKTNRFVMIAVIVLAVLILADVAAHYAISKYEERQERHIEIQEVEIPLLQSYYEEWTAADSVVKRGVEYIVSCRFAELDTADIKDAELREWFKKIAGD